MNSQNDNSRILLLRWMKFNVVGWIGIGVQLAALALFKSKMHFNYLIATAMAVEITILHNFIWHEHYTWQDRRERNLGLRGVARRLLKFNLTTGTFSIAGNVAAMKVFAGTLHINYFVANCFAIIVCSLLNFVMTDRFVFRKVSTQQVSYSA